MDRKMIADRINRLLGKTSNAVIGRALGVSREAVSQWRLGKTWPRLEKLDELALYCNSTPEYILFEIKRGEDRKSVEHLRERLCQTDKELHLLTVYRAANDEGEAHIIAAAEAFSSQFPRPRNVTVLRRNKRK